MRLVLRSQTVGIAALILGISVFLSRILGLIRDKIISYYFGSSLESDVYFVAFVIPDFISYLLAGGYFSITLVPLLAKSFQEDSVEAWRFFSSAVTWATICIVFLCFLSWILAPQLAYLVAPGFSEEKIRMLVHYLRIILPAQIFFLPGACFTAVLYCRKQFTVPSLSPLIYNSSIILGGLSGIYYFPGSGMEGFCWGVLVGAFLGSFLLPVLSVQAGGLRFRPRLKHKKMLTLALLALPLMLGQSVSNLDEQFIRIFGSLSTEGDVSLLSYSKRVLMVPVGIIAQAAGLASYPFLAALADKKDFMPFNKYLNQTLNNALLIAVPVSIWMMSTSGSLMRLIFQQGQFTPEAAEQAGWITAIMLLSVSCWTIQQILSRAYYAYQNTLTPALLGSLATILVLPLYYVGVKKFGSFGIAGAGTLGIYFYTLFLMGCWARHFGKNTFSTLGASSLKSLLVSLAALIPASFFGACVQRLFPPQTLSGAFFYLCTSACIFCFVYFLLAKIFFLGLLKPFYALYKK